jgi:hypothetical protein
MEEEMRHDDHRFEWTREQFAENVNEWSKNCPYHVKIQGIGEDHPTFGQPTQMAIFRREEE